MPTPQSIQSVFESAYSTTICL